MVLIAPFVIKNHILGEDLYGNEPMMLDGLISNIKSRSMKMSTSLSNFKTSANYNLDNFKSKFKDNNSPEYCSVEYNPIANSPSPSNPTQTNKRWDLKWPIIVDNKLHWVPHVPFVEDDNDNDLIERFNSITVIEDAPRVKASRCNDREEIRRRLAMGNDGDDYFSNERSGRKPSLQSRLQSGMNLQICFMNETMSDNESPNSDTESSKDSVPTQNFLTDKTAKRPATLPVQTSQFGPNPPNQKRPSTSLLSLPLKKQNEPRPFTNQADFYACQAQLQAEARVALAQAKEMAHMQMEIERQRQKKSPITEMVRTSLQKVGITFPEDRRRLSRQILTEMNVAQLQVIVNDLHTQIEILNDSLVKFLMDRDDLHMEQDSMLVDIEDLTRYLGAKDIGNPDWNTRETKLRHNNKSISVEEGKM